MIALSQKTVFTVVLLLFATLFAWPAMAAPTYTATAIGVNSGAWGINASGQVIGGQVISPTAGHAFLYSGGTATDLGTLGGSYSYAGGINATAQMCGTAYTADAPFTQQHAFFYTSGQMTDLGTLGGNESSGNAINDSGHVTGYAYTTNNAAYHAFLNAGGTMTDLGTLGGNNSFGYAINASDQIAGFSQLPSGPTGTNDHAFLYSNGTMTDLGTLGGSESKGYGINANGEITGLSSIVGDAAYHAFRYANGQMIDLGTLGGTVSEGYAINSSRQVVGLSYIANNASQHAFLYTDGAMHDLNALVVSGLAGDVLTVARGINDAGQIAATSCGFQTCQAYRLDPVPASPATATTLTSSANPANGGTVVTLTATVVGVAPSGSVRFSEGGTSLSGCASVAVAGGGDEAVATCSTSALSVGTHRIVATYSGDAGNGTSSSSPLTQGIRTAIGGTNVALAVMGAIATASSTFSGAFPAAAVNDNERTGARWGSGGGWNDATGNAFPDWIQIAFNGKQTIDRAIVYTLQDNFANPIEPTDTLTFNQWGVTKFNVQGWTGSAWTTLGTVTGNNLVKRAVTFPPYTTDRIRININSGLASYSRITEIEAWGVAEGTPLPTTTTVASSKNPLPVGATVTFTATVTGINPTGTVIFKSGGAYVSGCIFGAGLTGTGNVKMASCSTSTLQIGSFGIFAQYLGDNSNAPSEDISLVQVVSSTPAFAATDSLTSSLNPSNFGDAITLTATVTGISPTGTVDFYGARGGFGCVAIPLTGTGNTKSAECRTSALAVGSSNLTAAYSGDGNNTPVWGELTQVVNPSIDTNFALASNGGIAAASSVIGPGFPVASINNNERTGVNWGNGGGWNDATGNAFPDWVQLTFAAAKSINRVVVYSLQDNYANPVEPTDTQSFALYGVTAFTVQAKQGGAWVTVATVNGNNLVKRTVTFAPVVTNRIRINVTNALASYSRIVEIEAWGQ